ncbi:GIY-YIG nuclease family protein [Salinimicrobium terrae]|uniref:GIY-YIG nuclease family protein n=1 Tax=Salinimicrobium terrae TaxID=470866 RepID=UPI0004196684
MHFLYIIYSPTTDKYFTGETNNVPTRIELHNSHKRIKAFTKAASDWEAKLIFKCTSKEEATYLKGLIKKKKNRKFIEEIIDHPELLADLLEYRVKPSGKN